MPDDTTARFTRKGRATRARIVDVAAKLMFQRGVAGTSIDEVRNTAAVSGSQISHYFHDKRDLTRKVIGARSDDVREFHSQPRLGALDSFEALHAWAEANIADINAVYRQGGCVYGSLAGELVEADAEIHGDLAAGYDRWIRVISHRTHRNAPARRSTSRRRPPTPGSLAGRRASGRRPGHLHHR